MALAVLKRADVRALRESSSLRQADFDVNRLSVRGEGSRVAERAGGDGFAIVAVAMAVAIAAMSRATYSTKREAVVDGDYDRAEDQRH